MWQRKENSEYAQQYRFKPREEEAVEETGEAAEMAAETAAEAAGDAGERRENRAAGGEARSLRTTPARPR